MNKLIHKIDINSRKTLIILCVLSFCLLLTYSFSFVKKTDKRKSIKTALVNEKYKDSICKIQFSQNNEKIELFKNNDIWFINETPADGEKIKAFVQNLTQIRTVYKITDKISQNNSYGVTDGTELKVRYYYSENDFMDLIFGKQDFSNTNRYFMNGKTAAVYEIDNSLNKYLTLSKQFWMEQFIISQNVLGIIKEQDVQGLKIYYDGAVINKNPALKNWNEIVHKLFELRHGGNSDIYKQDLDLSCEIELGNKNQIIMNIYTTDDSQEYIVEVNYNNYFNNSKITTQVKISLWTYNKIKEIML